MFVVDSMIFPQPQLEGSASSPESVAVEKVSLETNVMKVRFYTIFEHLDRHVWAIFAEVVSTVLSCTCQRSIQSLHQF